MENKLSKNEKSYFIFSIIKRFIRWEFRNIVIIMTLIITNGILVISGVYPSWIGYFNYLFAILPIFIKI